MLPKIFYASVVVALPTVVPDQGNPLAELPLSMIYKHEAPYSVKVESPIVRHFFPEPPVYRPPELPLDKSPFAMNNKSTDESAKPSQFSRKRGPFDWNLVRDLSIPGYSFVQNHPYSLGFRGRAQRRMKKWDVVEPHGPAMPGGFVGYVFSLD